MLSNQLVSEVTAAVNQSFTSQTDFLLELLNTSSAQVIGTPAKPLSTEREAARLIHQKLRSFKLKPEYIASQKNRPNVVARLGPTRARKSLILNGHLDTRAVPTSYRGDPFAAYVRGERVYGLGVYDSKASLSAFTFLPQIFKTLKLDLSGQLILQFVVDELSGANSPLGTEYLLSQGIKAKAAILGKPGNCLGIGHRGGYRFKITTKGEAVHTGMETWQEKSRGQNAVTDMARVIEALKAWELPFKVAKAFPGKKPVFTFPTLIKGGQSINIVPALCEAWGDVRLMPGNSDRQVRLLIEDLLSNLKDIDWEITDLLFIPAVEVDSREEIVESTRRAFGQALGQTPKLCGIGAWNEGYMYIQRDIPTVVQLPLLGGGLDQGHEWVELESLKNLTLGLALTVIDYLGVE